MRKFLAVVLAAVALVAVSMPAAQADKPARGCPPGDWQTSVFPLNWQPGDPMDPTGENLLLQIGVAGTIEEFGSLEAGLAAFGFSTLEEFYAAAIDPGYNRIDRNDDGVLCVKPFPETGGQAAYLANAVDNTANQ